MLQFQKCCNTISHPISYGHRTVPQQINSINPLPPFIKTIPTLTIALPKPVVSMFNYKQWQQPPISLVESVKASRAVYRRLGDSGLIVSNPILGGMHIGDPGWGAWVLDENKSIALLKAAYDRGINTVRIPYNDVCVANLLWVFVVGHSQYILQWRVRKNHRQSTTSP